ncbi:MAG: ATP-binding cassette domain-containing protein [Proteobacteria bacterium]|nr:ATP-binding cassette domain-containing protein [Pseudomonadota bacterium]
MSYEVRQLINYLLKHFRSLTIVMVSLFAVSASLLLIGYVVRRLIDKGLTLEQMNNVHSSIIFLSVLIAIFSIGSFFRSYYINLISLKVTSELKSDTFKNLLNIDLARFEDLKIGDIISRLGTDIEIIGNLIINFLSFLIRNLVMLIGAIILMFINSPKLSIIVVISIPILLIPILRLSRHVRSLSRKVLDEQSIILASAEECFTGIRTIHAYNQQSYLSQQFGQKINSNIKHSSTRLKLRSIFFALAIMIIAGSITFVLWVGSIDIINGSMTSGQMVSFIYYAVIVGMSAGGIAELLNELHNPLSALERILELRDIASLNYSSLDNEPIPDQINSVQFQNVIFAYPAREDITILKELTFSIKAGKFTGIVGPSGAGKSTIFQLLMRFYTQYQGSIMLGDSHIKQMNMTDLREKIAYVEQYPTIFSGTIRNNISFSCPKASNEEIEHLAQICGITEFARNYEFGLNTEIGERGIRISGGQKQRIAIARALLYKPDILLLDEATSALDNNSEEKIISNIIDYMHGKTIISIAHRITSIERADEILLIDHGTLAAQGTHKQLLKSSEIYKQLYESES